MMTHLIFTFITIFTLSLSFIEGSEPFYIAIQKVYPGQVRYSDYVVKEKIKEIAKTEKGKLNQNDSLFTLSQALPVVKAPYGYVLVDGHHHYLTNLRMNGSTIPIKVIADFSNLSHEEFLNVAEKEGLIHPYDVYGHRQPLPKNFHALQNDPNRLFASLSKRRYSLSNPGESKGHEYPIWIKVSKDIPFTEMRVSEALWNAGMIYNDREEGLSPNQVFYEKARQAVHAAKVKNLRVVPTRTHFTALNNGNLHTPQYKIKI